MTIGVFDSGIGGEAIAREIGVAFPDATVRVINDKKHVSYGGRSTEEIIRLTDSALQPLLRTSPDIIVIACNTATAVAISYLRRAYPNQIFIGLEPMVKPAAAMTRTRVIAVCATPATLGSTSYKNLKQTHGKDITILEPDTSEWAYLIENNLINRKHIEHTIRPVLEKSADVIVLACTHYHWIKDEIITMCRGRADVIEPSTAIIRRINEVITAG